MPYVFAGVRIPKKPRNRGRKSRASLIARGEWPPKTHPIKETIEAWLLSLSNNQRVELCQMYFARPPAPFGIKDDWIEEHGGQRAWRPYLFVCMDFCGISVMEDTMWRVEIAKE